MFSTILSRMILWELSKVFVMALIAITGKLLLAGLIAEATQQGLGPSQILAAIPLLIPSTLPYTIPATTLFATCVVYGRFSSENEILAIKATGVNLIHVVKPALLVGLLMSGVTLALYYHLIPSTHHMLRSMVIADAEELLYAWLKRHGTIPNNPEYAMYVRNVEGRKLIWPVIKHRDQKTGQIDTVAYAREADLRVDMDRKLLVVSMRFGVVLNENHGSEPARADFVQKTFEVELPKQLPNHIRPRDLTWPQLNEQREELTQKLTQFDEEIDSVATVLELPNAPPEFPIHLKQLKDKRREVSQQIRHIDVEKLMRPALSLGCLCFILVGCPVGIWFSRGDYLGAFITCFLPIVIVYYPLTLCGTNLAKEGRFNEVALVYGADALMGLTGLVLFRRLLRN